ncbi:MAG: hypothetical protein ACRDHL_06830 [Candidatus Promineifilaceae bacterium]
MTPKTGKRLTLHTAATGLVLALALGFSLLYLYVGLARVSYPYSLDFIEDSLVMQAWRAMQAEPTYLASNADYVPNVYMPLYPWLGGLLFKWTGPGFTPLRALSFAATLATAGLVYWIAGRESRSRLLAFGCAGLFLAGYRLAGGWYELARVENLYVLLTLAGVAAAIYRPPRPGGLALAGVLLGLSFLTKQHGLIFGAGTFVFLLMSAGRRAWLFAAAFALFGLAPFWLANRASDGWLATYTFGVAYASPVEAGRVVETLRHEIFGAMLLLTLAWIGAPLAAFGRLGWRPGLRRLLGSHPWPIFIAAAVLVTIVTRASVGGARQNYILGYAFLCLAPALMTAEMTARWPAGGGRAYSALLLGLSLQFGLSWSPAIHRAFQIHNATQFVPTAEMRAGGDRLIERIAAVEGPVFVMMHPPYALMAGKEPSVHIQSLWHARYRGRDRLPADLVARIESQYYALIISNVSPHFESEPALVKLLETHYRQAEVLPPSVGPPTLSGLISRPQVLYVPRQAQAAPAGLP